MVSISSTPTLTVATSTKDKDSVEANAIRMADAAMALLLKDDELLQSLGDQSSRWVPPSNGKILATLWGMFNTTGTASLTKDNVELAIYAHGGGSSHVDALWTQLNPKKNDRLPPGDFAVNEYLRGVVNANMKTLLEDVEVKRIESQAAQMKSNSLLDFIVGGSASILDRFV